MALCWSMKIWRYISGVDWRQVPTNPYFCRDVVPDYGFGTQARPLFFSNGVFALIKNSWIHSHSGLWNQLFINFCKGCKTFELQPFELLIGTIFEMSRMSLVNKIEKWKLAKWTSPSRMLNFTLSMALPSNSSFSFKIIKIHSHISCLIGSQTDSSSSQVLVQVIIVNR